MTITHYNGSIARLIGVTSRALQTTIYTSGSGNYTPIASNSLVRVTMVGGGGGGAGGSCADNTRYSTGGGGGACKIIWLMLTGATPYVVGSGGSGGTGQQVTGNGTSFTTTVGGTNGTAGSNTRFLTSVALGGMGGSNGSSIGNAHPINGGMLAFGGQTGTSSFEGESGGAPGYISAISSGAYLGKGCAPGHPSVTTSYNNSGASTPGKNDYSYAPGSCGGDSTYGIGGSGGSSVSAQLGGNGSIGNGYGAGGGGGCNVGASNTNGLVYTSGNGGNGANGIIIIEDFGA